MYFRRSGAVILISRSFDGELITRILQDVWLRRGARVEFARRARGAAGPEQRDRNRTHGNLHRGRAARAQSIETKMGPIKLAQTTGAPIGAFHLQPERAWTMNSWDRFLVPKPFTRIVVSWAQWTRVPADTPA